MVHILFRCPHTGLNAQHRLDDDASPLDKTSEYEGILCSACMRLHFVNRSTGKTLGENKAKDVKPLKG